MRNEPGLNRLFMHKMRLQEKQASTRHDISMEANRVVMDHVHGLHKGSTALLPTEGSETKL
jgi:hypothetical protein